jgi:hypothetical protein
MRALADGRGGVYLLYRAATEEVNRDMFLLASSDRGRSFQGVRLDRWKLNTCPMSTAALGRGRGSILAAWETEGQVFFAEVDPAMKVPNPTAARGAGGARKHPVIAVNARGETILAWTEGTGWKKGGSVAWQVFAPNGEPTAERGTTPGVPVWGLAAVVAGADDGFTIIY